MKPSRWAIRLTNGREDRGLLVVRHGVAAVYAEEGNAQREAKWLCGIAKRNGSETVYSPTPWRGDMEMELQDRLNDRSGGSKRTSPDPTSRGGGNSKSDIPESSENSLSELLHGSSDTDGTA
jgi:hypothetical protein